MKDTAEFFKVLSDEARLQMLWLLFHHREICVCDFMTTLQITQSKASRHLRTLRHAGLVTDRKEGLWSYYALCPVEEESCRQHLKLLRSSLAKRPDAAALLERLQNCRPDRVVPVSPRPIESRRASQAQGPRGSNRRTNHGKA